MPLTLEKLNQQFALPGLLRFEAGEGGLTRATIETPAAQAHVYLHGAHVATFNQTGRPPLLFVSAKSHFEAGKPIRGGVPVIFPWFGAHSQRTDLPAHGFVRLRDWEIDSVAREPGGGVTLTLLFRHDEQSLALWPHRFELRHRVSIVPGGEPVPGKKGKAAPAGEPASIEMSLIVRNTGDAPFTFEEALHTYFHVGDVRSAKVTGLEGVTYNARNEGDSARVQQGPITFSGETDRLYQGTPGTCLLEDASLGRTIRVEKAGSLSTVVWNPWIDKARAMPDFGDDEWPGMLCIETANARAQSVALAPGQSHTMTAIVR